MERDRLVQLILRFGVAFAFAYPAVAAWIAPYDWIGYFPIWMKGYVPDAVLLHTFGLTEIIIALWILSGFRILIPSVLASLYLAAIVLLNLQSFDVIFRDISILAAAIALVIMSNNRK